MEEQQKSIDEIFRQSLGDYREAPPAAAWNKVVQRLEDDERGRRGFFRRPWIMLTLLFLIGSAWFIAAQYLWSRKQEPLLLSSKSTEAAVSAPNTPVFTSPDQNAAPENAIAAIKGPGSPSTDEVSIIASESKYDAQTVTGGIEPKSTPGVDYSADEPAGKQAATQSYVGKSSLQEVNPAVPEKSHQDVALSEVPVAKSGLIGGGSNVRKNGYALSTLKTLATPASAYAVSKPADQEDASASGSRTFEAGLTSLRPGSGRQMANLYAERQPVAMPVDVDVIRGIARQVIAEEPAHDLNNMEKNSVSAQQNVRPAYAISTVSAAPAKLVTAARVGQVTMRAQQVVIPLVALADASAKDVSARSSQEQVTDLTKSQETVTKPVPLSGQRPSLSVAALVGYDHNINSPVQGNFGAALKLLVTLSPTVSLGLQPSYHQGVLSSTQVTQSQAYQRQTTLVETFYTIDASPSLVYTMDTLYNYVIHETFDSVVVSGVRAEGKQWTVALPLIVSVKLPAKGWYIYGGPSLNFGSKISTSKETVQTYTFTQSDSLVQSAPAPAGTFTNYFNRQSSLAPFESYRPYNGSTHAAADIRVGYIAGFGYEWNRLLFDASIRQQLSGYSNVPDALKSVYSSPSIRLGMGYVLTGAKRRH